jgi:hypothetical protein
MTLALACLRWRAFAQKLYSDSMQAGARWPRSRDPREICDGAIALVTRKISISRGTAHEREKGNGEEREIGFSAGRFSCEVQRTNNPGRLNRSIGPRSVDTRRQSNRGVMSRHVNARKMRNKRENACITFPAISDVPRFGSATAQREIPRGNSYDVDCRCSRCSRPSPPPPYPLIYFFLPDRPIGLSVSSHLCPPLCVCGDS